MKKRNAHKQHSYPLRMPSELKAALKQLAERDGRSLNGQMIHYLSDHVRSELPAQESILSERSTSGDISEPSAQDQREVQVAAAEETDMDGYPSSLRPDQSYPKYITGSPADTTRPNTKRIVTPKLAAKE